MKNEDVFESNLFELSNKEDITEEKVEEVQRRGGYCKMVMNLPNDCGDCVFRIFEYRQNRPRHSCQVLPLDSDKIESLVRRKSNCPLIYVELDEITRLVEVETNKVFEGARVYKSEISCTNPQYITVEDLEEFKRFCQDEYQLNRNPKAQRNIEAIETVFEIMKGNYNEI